MISTDLFDTVLLRDASTETHRLREASLLAAQRLEIPSDPVVRLRWWMHDDAYRTVAMTRPTGDARLTVIAEAMALALGLPADAAEIIRDSEVTIDTTHLRPNRGLLEQLQAFAGAGKRIIAVSDTYYSAADLARMLRDVAGRHPIAYAYSSSELGLTKHAGAIFAAVTAAEGVRADEIVHVGDSRLADVDQPSRAGWSTVHLTPDRPGRLRQWQRLRFAPSKLARQR